MGIKAFEKKTEYRICQNFFRAPYIKCRKSIVLIKAIDSGSYSRFTELGDA